MPGHRVWSVVRTDGGYRVDALGPAGNTALLAPSLVAATGAHERITPFPGWTLPGVIGLAAATILLKSHGVPPGSRVAVAGCGPLLPAVAAGLVAAGVEVLAVADLDGRGKWLRRAPALASRPGLLARGLGWLAAVRRAGVPWLAAHGVRRADGGASVSRVVLGPVNAAGAPSAGPERTFEVDALVVGHGLTTASDIPRLLRANHRFDRLRGGWVPVVDGAFRTSLPGLYAIGDGAGIRGQEAASLAGRRAGLDLAGSADGVAAIDAALARLGPFADAVAGLMQQRPSQVAAIESGTVVCRCEDVTCGAIDAAITAGATCIDQLKHFTRCGMGPCQGRFCADAVQERLAARTGRSREAVGQWTARPPLRPVPLGDLTGTFSYDDIPIPEPAPL
jgi:bacterioferritin-associated ferredoxin